MLIEKMTIENFRQYKGKQEIFFSTDKEKNVTLILGDNGSGKTVISQAFVWCFYGETPGFTKKESLLSKGIEEEMCEGWERSVNVQIFMEHSNRKYEVSRTIKYVRRNGKITPQETSFRITKVENGERKFLINRELENCINEILPRELSQYFFLSGEKIDSMSTDIKSGRQKDFSNAVNTLLDLDYYKNAIKHLNAISKEYDVSTIPGMQNELQTIITRIENCDANLNKFKELKEKRTEAIEFYNNGIIDCESKLRTMKSSHDIQVKIDDVRRKISQTDAAIKTTIENGINDFVKKIPYAVLQPSIEKMNSTLERVTKIEDTDIPERLHAELIDWIEKRGECICGNKIKEESSAYELLEKWRHIVPPESIGILANQIKSKASDKLLLGEDLEKNLKNYQSENYRKYDYIDELNDSLKSLNEELKSTTDTTNIGKQLNEYREERRKCIEERDGYVKYIESLETEKENALREKKRTIEFNEEGKKLLAWKKMAEKLRANFERQLEEDENEKRNLLINSVKAAFKNIYGDSFSIYIDENYRITTTTDLEKSTGQGMAVIFSFLAGLLDVIKTHRIQNIGKDEKNLELESYPLVLDAPFSALDKQRISSICKVLPKVSEQIIIFIKDTDGNIAKEEMRGKIGICYKLTKIGKTDTETIIEKEDGGE